VAALGIRVTADWDVVGWVSEDLRLHDLRHEAVSRFFEYGLTVPEVALISGHRDPRMLIRYTHLRPEIVAEILARVAS
jgi:integrase